MLTSTSVFTKLPLAPWTTPPGMGMYNSLRRIPNRLGGTSFFDEEELAEKRSMIVSLCSMKVTKYFDKNT
jgi:hypothetical protein